MAKRPRKRIRLAQNFLKDPALARRLVGLSSIGRSDIVYEIGPGRGIITAELARTALEVTAVEKDARLVRALRERFRSRSNVRIVERDFLDCKPPGGDYKIFASIPYNATASIVRKILDARYPPTDAYLIVQREPARKFTGLPHETLFSLLAKPVFEFRILHRLRRIDFFPEPSVDSVLLHIRQREQPLLRGRDLSGYRNFVSYAFNRQKQRPRNALKRVFTANQWSRLARDLRFSPGAERLNFKQWLGLYQGYERLCQYRPR